MENSSPQSFRRAWRALFNVTVLSAYFYVAMEWIFFVTKPSPISNLTTLETLQVLMLTGGAAALVPLVGVTCFLLGSLAANSAVANERSVRAAYIFPALILSVTALIMLDNFTYTVFRFGIISAEAVLRFAYAAGFILFLLWTFRSLPKHRWIYKRPAYIFSLALMFLPLIGFSAIYLSEDPNLHNPYTNKAGGEYPNIIIVGGDGLSAEYLSAYGFSLKTTPFLSQLKNISLFAENAFPNAASTTASTASILTGKESTQAKVFRYPDILLGRDSFEHLPGILQQHGYLTVQVGTPYYVDAGELNLLDGFEITHNTSLDLKFLNVFEPILGNSHSMYLLRSIAKRATERLLHILFIRKMDDAITAVHDPTARISDNERVDLILDTLDGTDRPIFIFSHMMDTHGPEFSSEQFVFSTGHSSEEWDVSNYLDAILTFDNNVKRIYDHLEQSGKLDDTILVVYTDHGFKYTINERIPILIRFPNDEFSGTIQNNVQVIDVPVTLLDYAGISQPEWMTGTSLLQGEPQTERVLFATTSGAPEKIAPPFHQINILQAIICDRWYQLNVRKYTFRYGAIYSHTASCSRNPDQMEVYQTLVEYLEQHGYDTQSLR